MTTQDHADRQQFMVAFPALDAMADNAQEGGPVVNEARRARGELLIALRKDRAMRQLHGARLYTDVAAHVTIPICAECRQDHPCATIKALDAAVTQ